MGRPMPVRFTPPPALAPSYAPAPTPPSPWHPPPPPPPPPSSHPDGGFIVFLFLVCAFVVSLFGFFSSGPPERDRENHNRADAAVAASAAAPPPPPPGALPVPPGLRPSRHFQELRLRQARAADPAARRLPAFQYNRSVKHNATGGGEEEAATCPVCLGAFELGEMVRLLPLCLHLYHVECIDLWLEAHSTCPICRSNTVPTMDAAARLPPV